MLHPKEMEVLNKMIETGKPVSCSDIADGEELLFNTVKVAIRRLVDGGYVIVDGHTKKGSVLANLYSVTNKARSVAVEQTVNEILKLRYLIEPTTIMAELVQKMEV